MTLYAGLLFPLALRTTADIFSVWNTQPKAEGCSMQGHHFPSALRRCVLAS